MKTLYEDLKMLGLMESVSLKIPLDWYDPEAYESPQSYDEALHDNVLIELEDFIKKQVSIDTWSRGDNKSEPKNYYARLTNAPDRMQVEFSKVGDFPLDKLEKIEFTVNIEAENIEWPLEVTLTADETARSADDDFLTIDYKITTSPKVDQEF